MFFRLGARGYAVRTLERSDSSDRGVSVRALERSESSDRREAPSAVDMTKGEKIQVIVT
jgi:hypothetical protein